MTFTLPQSYVRPHCKANEDFDPYFDIYESNFHVSLLRTLAQHHWKSIAHEKIHQRMDFSAICRIKSSAKINFQSN